MKHHIFPFLLEKLVLILTTILWKKFLQRAPHVIILPTISIDKRYYPSLQIMTMGER